MSPIVAVLKKSCIVTGILAALAASALAAGSMQEKIKSLPARPEAMQEASPAASFIDLKPTEFIGVPPSGTTEDKATYINAGLGVWVQNQGTLASGPFKTAITCMGIPNSGKNGKTPVCPNSVNEKTCVHPDGIKAKGSGECFLIMMGFASGIPELSWKAGKYRMRAIVDVGGAVTETNENNNALETIIEIVP